MHHGNGTEAGFRMNNSLFYGSTHEKDNFPGTGFEPDLSTDINLMHEYHRRIVNRYLHAGPESKPEFRIKWKQILLEMERFKPGLIIISAGFDAHVDDPLANCELTEEDYSWATAEIWASSYRINPSSPPPCVSVLEGGYDLDALASSVAAHVKALAAGPPPQLPVPTGDPPSIEAPDVSISAQTVIPVSVLNDVNEEISNIISLTEELVSLTLNAGDTPRDNAGSSASENSV